MSMMQNELKKCTAYEDGCEEDYNENTIIRKDKNNEK